MDAPMITSARHLKDMREIVAYDIVTDTYEVRYHWIEGAEKKTFLAESIHSGQHLNEALEDRRVACLKHRGIE
jgi:hypothetical protein